MRKDELLPDEEPTCCCGCMLAKHGCYFFGILYMLWSGTNIVCWLMFNTKIPIFGIPGSYPTALIILLASSILFLGLEKQSPNLILPFLLVTWLEAIHYIALIITGAFFVAGYGNLRKFWSGTEEEVEDFDKGLVRRAGFGIIFFSIQFFVFTVVIIDTLMRYRKFLKRMQTTATA